MATSITKKMYVEINKKLSPEQRLRLASWILDDLIEVDSSDWRMLSLEQERAVWDNPIDAEDWDNWQLPKGGNRGTDDKTKT